jgi:hypothetical protein
MARGGSTAFWRAVTPNTGFSVGWLVGGREFLRDTEAAGELQVQKRGWQIGCRLPPICTRSVSELLLCGRNIAGGEGEARARVIRGR